MYQWLKKHFIPHKGNDYQPHFLRLKITAGLFGLILIVEALYLAQTFIVFPKSDYLAAIFATVLIDQTNAQRAGSALGTLTPNDVLKRAAQMKADDMAAKGYFAHVTPDGKEPWYWFDQSGYKYSAAGENLAVNFTESTDVTNAWMQSPTHRANIMNGKYTEIGIATAEGIYKGRNAIFVVEEFGLPAPTVPVPAAPTQKITPPVASVKPKSPTPTTTVLSTVAGAETTVASANDNANDNNRAALPPTETVIPGAPAHSAPLPSSLLVTSPRKVTTTFYLILGSVLLLALLLAVFIEIRIQHTYIIVNGLALVLLIGLLVSFNATISLGTGVI